MAWPSIPFPETVRKTSVGRENQIPASEIKAAGRFPVIDQGQSFIAGYSDDESRLITRDLPLIVFGDHTRVVKFVDFPFILGADGTKVLKPRENDFDARFFAFALQSFKLPNRGYNRHFTLLKEKRLYRPELDEQRKIAGVLRLVERAIEQQERLLALTAEMKKALLHQLFTHGLRNEPQKHTELGPMQQSWRIGTLQDVKLEQKGAIVSGPFGSNIGKRFFVESGVPLIRGCNLTKGEQLFVEKGFVFITEEKAQELKSCEAVSGDLIFTAAGTLGQVGLIPADCRFPKYVISNKQLRARIDPAKADGLYLFYWFTSDIIQALIAQRRSGSSIPVINLSILRSLPVPLPQNIEEQREIASSIAAIDEKRDLHRRKHAELISLFRTLLHELMTAQIRLNHLELRKLER